MAEETLRVRLVFEDRRILRKAQRKEGLKHCWVLLKLQHQTISEFSDYLLQKFDLRGSCPHGLLLAMDGFVLPPFESTCILKDNDIVSVRKKRQALAEIVKRSDAMNCSDEMDLADEKTACPGVELLANEEFRQETGGYETESEEDELETMEDDKMPDLMVSKKRKASRKIQNSKRKRCKLATAKVHPKGTRDNVQSSSPSLGSIEAKRRITKKVRPSDLQGELEKNSAGEADAKEKKNCKPSVDSKRPSQQKANGKRSEEVSQMSTEAKKQPSRSARRKKAKRRWLREQAKLQQEEPHQAHLIVKDSQESVGSGDKNVSEQHTLPLNEVNGDIGEEFVPVQVRPGHIRFESLDDDDQAIQSRKRSEVRVETFQWNGITSKKKGQKWGKESSYPKRNDQRYSQEFFQEQAVEADLPQKQAVEAVLPQEQSVEAEMPMNGHLDYDRLTPYSGSPKEGDVIAYRLIELSSSWTPEISSFRVGKISSYNVELEKVTLVEVPEYPIKKLDDGAQSQIIDASLYQEDGSLEIDFSSLLDLRLVKHGGSSHGRAQINGFSKAYLPSQDAKNPQPSENNELQMLGKVAVNGETNAWDEISEALSAKKAELSRGFGREKKENVGRGSWSYKAMRSSALGPTMALLRAQDGL